MRKIIAFAQAAATVAVLTVHPQSAKALMIADRGWSGAADGAARCSLTKRR